MDERQQQIRERAGLEESRLNQDFIDFLTKWGTPLLAVVAIAAGSVWGYNRWTTSQRQQLDKAFGELALAGESEEPSPESLKKVAEEYGTKAGVGFLARMEAADALMRSVRRGVRAGAELAQDGALAKPEDALTEAERTEYLTQAGELYRRVADTCREIPERKPFLVGALFGVAATAEGKLEWDGAKAAYDEIVRLTEGTDWAASAAIAKARVANLDALKSLPRIYTRAEIPKIEAEVPPVPGPTPGQSPELVPGPMPAPIPAPEAPPVATPVTPTVADPAAPVPPAQPK